MLHSRLALDLSLACHFCGFIIPQDWTVYESPAGKPMCGRCRSGVALTIVGGNRKQRRGMSCFSRR